MCINHVGFNNQHENLYEQSINIRIFILMINKDIHTSSQNYEKSGFELDLDFTNHLVLIACFIS